MRFKGAFHSWRNMPYSMLLEGSNTSYTELTAQAVEQLQDDDKYSIWKYHGISCRKKRYQTQLAYGLQGWHRGKAASRAEKQRSIGRPRTHARRIEDAQRLAENADHGSDCMNNCQLVHVGRGCRVTESGVERNLWPEARPAERSPCDETRRDKIRWSVVRPRAQYGTVFWACQSNRSASTNAQ